MTNLIRIKHTFLYSGKKFFCGDLTVEDFILINTDNEAWTKKILSEFNDKIPDLNGRQIEEFFKILFWEVKNKKTLSQKLTDTQKKINEYKKKKEEKKRTPRKKNDPLDDFHIIEGMVMHFMSQPLSEIRKWNYLYFMKIFKDIGVCTGREPYDKKRESQAPDKRWFKQAFWHAYSNKK